jgi:hypothetical protein
VCVATQRAQTREGEPGERASRRLQKFASSHDGRIAANSDDPAGQINVAAALPAQEQHSTDLWGLPAPVIEGSPALATGWLYFDARSRRK